MDAARLRERVVEALGPWFHQLTLADGVRTRDLAPAPGPESPDNPRTRWVSVAAALPRDIRGARVLDLGCLDGYFSVQLADLGAGEVVAMDSWREAIARVELVKEAYALDRIVPRLGSVYDLDPDEVGHFDLAVMIDVLYALDHPLLALERVAGVTSHLYLSTTVLRGLEGKFMELRRSSGLHGTLSRYWVPTEECLAAMLEAAGFDDLTSFPTGDPEHVLYRALRTASADGA